NREVDRGLKESDLTPAFATDPARRQVRDTTVRESKANVRDIDPAGQHRDANGFDRLDVSFHQRQHHVQVVNHQIEYDVDVQAAIGKRSEPVDLDETWIDEQRPRGLDRRI